MDEARSQVGKAWCSPHDCPPSDCFQRHVDERISRQSFLQEMVPPEDQFPVCPHRKTRHFEIGGKSFFWCEECNPFKNFGR